MAENIKQSDILHREQSSYVKKAVQLFLTSKFYTSDQFMQSQAL